MKRSRSWSIALLLIAIVTGTAADRPHPRPVVVLGGYRVLAADFHVHSSMWSDGALTPWGLVLEARRQGLDAMAVTAHNELVDAHVSRLFSERIGGPTILTGQEILAPGHHVIAVGVESVIDWYQPVAAQIDAVHRQGGVTIAAHPMKRFWPGFDQAAMERLDGAEICHPLVFEKKDGQRELEQFAARTPLAAVGSSDFHGLGRLGTCRTYVFARDDTAPAIVEALRAHRTVVYGAGGKAYGDPALIELAASRPELRDAAMTDAPAGWLDWISRICGIAGLVGIVVLKREVHEGPRSQDV